MGRRRTTRLSGRASGAAHRRRWAHVESRPGIEGLIGEELNVVSFVMDYVEFHFNGPVLRALTKPTVEVGRGA